MAHMPSDVVKTRLGVCWLSDQSILHVRVQVGDEITREMMEESVAVGRAMTSGRRYGLLVNLGKATSMTREARAYMSERNSPANTNMAVALVTGSPVSRILGNFFIGFNRPQRPVRLFGSEGDAAQWLREIIASPAPQAGTSD
jgi:hypothetical protein